jgi:hypothetical protein
MRYLIGRRHNFYPGIFSTQISNIEYLSPENFIFDFDQGQTLVLPSRGLSEFSQISYLKGRRHNFYPGIFSTKISNIEYLPPEHFIFDFDQGQTFLLPSRGLFEFSQMSYLTGRRNNFYPGIFSTQISNIEYLPPENSTFDFDQGQTLVIPSRGLS